MNPRTNIIFSTIQKVRTRLPKDVHQKIFTTIPIFFCSSLFEVFSLALVVPFINIILDPTLIQTNKYLHAIHAWINTDDILLFVLILFVFILIIFILKNIFLYYINLYQSRICFNIAEKIAQNKYLNYMNKPYSYYLSHNTSIFLRNISEIPFNFVGGVYLPLLSLVNETIILIITSAFVGFINPSLFISLGLFAIPFLFIYSKLYKSRLEKASSLKDESNIKNYHIVQESLRNYREIVLFNKKPYFTRHYFTSLHKYVHSLSDVFTLNLYSPKIVETVAVLVMFGVFLSGYIFRLPIQSVAEFLIVFAVALFRIIPSINKIVLSINYIKSNNYVFDYFDEDDLKPASHQETQDAHGIENSLNFKKSISIEELSFRYSESEEDVLKNVSLEISKGQKIGLVGRSGSGKTTLINILLRLLKETGGRIKVDGQQLDASNLGAWRQLFSYVPQNVVLLDASLAQNIAFGVPENEVDRGKINDVLAKTQLTDLIASLPKGLDTRIGENGVKLSGGQRQRIGIARALYHGCELLIFDEATSALDSETEHQITEDLHDFAPSDLTMIIVAHRTSTLKYCDIIYPVADGKIQSPVSYAQLTGMQ